MTKETLEKIETLVAIYNHNTMAGTTDAVLMIIANSGMLNRAINAKIQLLKVLHGLEKNGYAFDIKTTRDGFIASISWVKK